MCKKEGIRRFGLVWDDMKNVENDMVLLMFGVDEYDKKSSLIDCNCYIAYS